VSEQTQQGSSGQQRSPFAAHSGECSSLFSAFIVGLGYFTRLPCTGLTPYSDNALNRSTLFLWLYGLLVGFATSLCLWLATALQLPTGIAVLLSILAGLLLTGGFHEDGLADSCDGFGGGWSKHQVLTIMKDSRLGTYGALGLFMALTIKWQALTYLAESSPSFTVVLLVVSHSISRAFLALTMWQLSYVRDDLDSKAKPIAQSMPFLALLLNSGCALIAALLAWGIIGLIPLGFLVSLQYLSARYFKLRLGGYTGDCLGAQQQITELACYLLGVVMVGV
jgi:adenosylcobinamide-GDP ribazoletransferase